VVAHWFHLDTCVPEATAVQYFLVREVALPAIAPGRSPARLTPVVRDGNVISEYVFLNGEARAADQGIRARRSSRLRHGAVLAAGVRRTPLDRLVRRTGASRYGLYATFRGKRDLLLASLERYSQAVMDPMLEPLENARASATEIRRFFDRVLDVIRRPAMVGVLHL